MRHASNELQEKTGQKPSSDRRGGLLAAGGVIGAFLASTCCIVPLVLVTVGVSGAWIGNLTALQPLKPLFVAVTLVFLGLGFWQVYFRPRPACDCATPQSTTITQTALWIATALVIFALSIDWWAPFFY